MYLNIDKENNQEQEIQLSYEENAFQEVEVMKTNIIREYKHNKIRMEEKRKIGQT